MRSAQVNTNIICVYYNILAKMVVFLLIINYYGKVVMRPEWGGDL